MEQSTAEEDLSKDEVLMQRMEAGLYGLQCSPLITSNLFLQQGLYGQVLFVLDRMNWNS